MIKCINCGNNTVMARFPSQIILSAEVTIPGEVETRILSDSLEERSEPRLIHWNLDHGDLQIGDLSPDDADEYRCTGCGLAGTLEDGTFAVVNVCRCGREDDGLFACTRFSCIMCNHCRDTYECSDCRNTDCFFHRNYTGTERPPESTFTPPSRRTRLREVTSDRTSDRLRWSHEPMGEPMEEEPR